jgi:ligand-binding sensor domain-containing protein
MYFNTARDGIFKLVDGIWIPQINAQTEAFNNETDYFYIDNENSHWLNNNIQLSVYNDSDLETITISNYTLETNNIKNIHKGENGLLYFITANNSEVAVLDTDGNWSVLSLPSSGASFESFRDILFLADNNIWLASNQGFYHYNGDSWIFNELINSSSIVADAEGGIYILFNGGILIIDNGVTTEYNVDNSPLANSIAIGHGVDADGNLWIASFDWDAGYAIQKVASDGTWTTYSKEDFPEVDKARGDFYFDANGNVWVSRGAFGAAKFDGTTWTNPFTGNTDEITNTDVQAIGSDANGKLYFAHQYGVTTLLDDEWDNLIIEEVPTNLSHSGTIQFNDAGTLWWASRSYGLFSYSLLGTNVVDFETQTISNLSIYPNPAVNYAMLDFTTKSNENVNISIYNNLGQLQSNLNLGKFTVGTFQERIEVAGFAKGFYTVQLEIGGQHFVERMVVQ